MAESKRRESILWQVQLQFRSGGGVGVRWLVTASAAVAGLVLTSGSIRAFSDLRLWVPWVLLVVVGWRRYWPRTDHDK